MPHGETEVFLHNNLLIKVFIIIEFSVVTCGRNASHFMVKVLNGKQEQ